MREELLRQEELARLAAEAEAQRLELEKKALLKPKKTTMRTRKALIKVIPKESPVKSPTKF